MGVCNGRGRRRPRNQPVRRTERVGGKGENQGAARELCSSWGLRRCIGAAVGRNDSANGRSHPSERLCRVSVVSPCGQRGGIGSGRRPHPASPGEKGGEHLWCGSTLPPFDRAVSQRGTEYLRGVRDHGG